MKDFIQNIVDIILIIGVLAPVIRLTIMWLAPKIKNERVKLLERYAIRVVNTVEQISSVTTMNSEQKRSLAYNKLAGYINNSGLNYKMTEEDISDLIESAVLVMNRSNNK
jgi:hypothetical protein